jgi:hypothetical protein
MDGSGKADENGSVDEMTADEAEVPRHKRAERRAHRKRVIRAAMRKFAERLPPMTLETFARKKGNHLAACSCFLCRSGSRKWSGQTLQERREELRQKDPQDE